MKITNNNNFNINNVGENVTLYGWVAKKRNLGGLIFIDLRDRSGIIQLVVKPENKFYEIAETLKSEYVIKVEGVITERESKNNNIDTGEIEVIVNNLEILNTSIELPFTITDDTTALEDTRLKYRYLDLRRNELKSKIEMRHKIMFAIREYLNDMGFWEIETPMLCKSTPEGARDYLVPSRIFNGKFYALPQSPQIFKQLLMVGGMEKYFQITKCFRDEDLRADRQPEFTQVDMEMSFVDEDDIMNIVEKMVAYIFKKVKNIDLKLPLRRMKYDDAIEYYGSDKPDLRFDMKIQNITEVFKNTEISFFKDIIENDGIINCLVVKNRAQEFSRKDIDKLTEFVKSYKAKGLAYLKIEKEVTGSISKVISETELKELKEKLNLEENDLVLIISDKYNIVKQSLGALRIHLAKKLNLISNNYEVLWVVDFPSFEYSEEENRYVACHHPFTAPKDSDVDKLLTDKAHCYSKAYDIVINGYEVGGGSIRIHDQKIQEKMFEALELTEEQIQEKFGFFVEALKYGTPPHGGLALGLDRFIMVLSGTDNIKDVIAFPKSVNANDLMSGCPSVVDEDQLKKLGIKISN